MEAAAVMMTALELERIAEALGVLEYQGRGDIRTLYMVGDYGASNVSSEKVVRIILSCVDIWPIIEQK